MKEKIPYKLNPNMIIKEYNNVFISETAHVLNPIGKIILDLIDGKNNVDSIIKKVQMKYPNTDGNAIGQDVLEFLNKLLAEEVIGFKDGK